MGRKAWRTEGCFAGKPPLSAPHILGWTRRPLPGCGPPQGQAPSQFYFLLTTSISTPRPKRPQGSSLTSALQSHRPMQSWETVLFSGLPSFPKGKNPRPPVDTLKNKSTVLTNILLRFGRCLKANNSHQKKKSKTLKHLKSTILVQVMMNI